jgi:antitoxin MazE
MRGLAKKWGNIAAIRIPGPLMAAANLQLDQAVDVREEDGRIIIEPIRPAAYDLAALLAGITDENRHGATGG